MKKILSKPQNLFVIICLVFSGIFMLLNPPFQAPDEDAHLFKMYGYSTGSVNFKKQNSYAGQILPNSLIMLQNYYDKYKFKTEFKTSINELSLASKVELKKNETGFFKFMPTAYTPVSYFPSFLIMFILKIFSVKPIAMIYIMRFCSLLTYLALTYYAIKITPVKKWLFFILATLPVNLYQGSAVSTDALTSGLIFLFTAYTLKLAYEKEKITGRKIGLWAGLITVINICKFAYFPLVFMFFLIPKEKFNSAKSYFTTFTAIFLPNILYIGLYVLYFSVINKGALTELTPITVDKFILIKDILKDPIEYLSAVGYTTIQLHRFFINNMISSFGWNSVMIPAFATNLYYVLIFLAAIYNEKENNFNLKIGGRFWLFGLVLAAYLLTITSIYTVYQRYPLIIGVQGRYLTPLLLPLFLILTNKFVKTDNKIIPHTIVGVSLFLLLTAVLCLIARFY